MPPVYRRAGAWRKYFHFAADRQFVPNHKTVSQFCHAVTVSETCTAIAAGLKLARPRGGRDRHAETPRQTVAAALWNQAAVLRSHLRRTRQVDLHRPGRAREGHRAGETRVSRGCPRLATFTTPARSIRRPPSTTSSASRRTRSKAAGGESDPTTFVIDWMPKSLVTRYGLYEHEYSWFPAGSQLQPALFTEYHCDTRTGHFLCELITPQAFEAAVVFERPRWPLLNTERRVMRYALKQIEAGGGRPSICDNGQRIEWRIAEPKIGTRYMCVAFHQQRHAALERQPSEDIPSPAACGGWSVGSRRADRAPAIHLTSK